MEHPLRYTHDQYGNGDYAQLDRWSGHPEYKQTANDSGSLIYTSDYGSYSSQESNHSGTTYSNLADCEEALHSPPVTAYDLPPPQLPCKMERRRDKPLPPPRMTSKALLVNKARVLEPVKEKKISFDDSSLAGGFDSNKNQLDNSVPSFATLPRKKKLASATSTGPTQSAPQVTWMKEVAQKGESINRSKSANSTSNKKPQGILKNKIEEQTKKGDTTGYIKRNTVQRILEQQRAAKNRLSAAPAPNQFYKSVPSVASGPEAISQQHKAWEYNYNGNNSTTTTAQVIGIFEPNKDGGSYIDHAKQNSAETEFEFPPPPSDQDISQLMLPGNNTVTSSMQRNDFTPLAMACVRGDRAQAITTTPTSTAKNTQLNERAAKPPVPQRLKKPNTTHTEKLDSRQNSREFNNDQTTPTQTKRLAVHNTKQSPPLQARPDKQISSYQHTNSTVNQITDDIVLPPPEFQEGNGCAILANQQPSYGDYELLSPDSTVLPTAAPRSYPHQAIVDQLTTHVEDNLKVTAGSKSKLPGNARVGYSPRYPNNTNLNRSSYKHISHHHQYSTEL